MESQKLNCNNCGNQVSENYCSNCGQRSKVGELSYRELGEDLSQSLFSLEAPIWLTMRMLFTKPGVLFNDYLKGSRKKYYKPVNFFILATALYLIIRGLTSYEPFMDTMINTTEDHQDITAAKNFMVTHITKFLFLLVTSLAVFLKLFFYQRYRFVEYITIAFYIAGIYALTSIVSVLLTVIFNGQLQQFVMLFNLFYFIFVCVNFFKGNLFWIGFKAFWIYLLSTLLYVMGSFGLSYLIVKYF